AGERFLTLEPGALGSRVLEPGASLQPPSQKRLLCVSGGRTERPRQVFACALAVAAAAIELTQRRIPEIVAQQPGRRVERLEQSDSHLGALPLGDGDRSIQRVDG